MPPAIGMTNLNGYSGSGVAEKVCSRMASPRWRSSSRPRSARRCRAGRTRMYRTAGRAWPACAARKAVQHVAAHVAVLRQGVGAGHHEQRAVQHDLDVQVPVMRVVEHVAENTSQVISTVSSDDEPAEQLAQPVERRSTASSSCCMDSSPRRVLRERAAGHPRTNGPGSGPGPGRSLLAAEIVVVGHLEIDHVVVLPGDPRAAEQRPSASRAPS